MDATFYVPESDSWVNYVMYIFILILYLFLSKQEQDKDMGYW
jgi:hypothetical protein